MRSYSTQAVLSSRMTVALPGILLLVAIIAIAVNGLNRPVSFDGAMNLQVAQSLANGEGYVRDYGGVRPFPREVQTNVPYVLPAAAVITLFGTDLVQSQAVNFAYLIAFLVLVVVIGTRFYGLAAGFTAALVLTVVPGFYQIGMNGWGELTALFWWLAGTWWLLGPIPAPRKRLAMAVGGTCLGLAIATKTVMFIGVGATVAVFTIWVLAQNGRNIGRSVVDLLIAASCLLLPLVLIEIWRLVSLGGSAQFLAWWRDQSAAITWQTGVLDTKHAEKGSKLVRHFQALARETRLPDWLLVPWLLIPLAGSIIALARNPVRQAWHRLWSATTLVVAIYLVWWLMITPDSHVRLRRIEIGLILTQGLWLFCWGWLWSKSNKTPIQIGAATLAGLVFFISSGLFANDAAFDIRKHWLQDMGGFHRLVDKVKQLPPGARLFGKGFLSSPQLAFYADRDLDDIDRYTAGDLASIGVGYIIADASAVNARRFAPELRRYPHEVIAMNLGYEIYRLDFKARKNPFGKREMNSSQVPSSVDFTARNYPFVFGLHGPSRTGWRWARTDAEILLHYRNERAVELKVHKPEQRYAKTDVPLVLTVSVDGCALGSQAVAPKEEHVLRFKIPTECRLVAGRNVRLQVLSNNMLATVPADLRQLSYVILAAGFVQ